MLDKRIVPDFDSNELKRFLREKFPGKQQQRMLYIPWAEARENDCYENVKKYIAKHGGSLVFGWSVWLWPGAFIEAYHHAAWLSPKGKLIDISPDSSSQAVERVLIEDSDSAFDDTMKPYLPVRLPLCDDPLVAGFLHVCNEIDKKTIEESAGFFKDFDASPELIELRLFRDCLLALLVQKY